MPEFPATEVFSPREIARAAGVSVHEATAAIGSADALVSWADAVRIARALARDDRAAAASAAPRPLFATISLPSGRTTAGAPLVVSSTLHAAGLAAVLLLTTLGLAPHAETVSADMRADPMRIVFLVTPGPGGGGGGGGLHDPRPAPKAQREGHRAISSPLLHRDPKLSVATPRPPEPKPISAEQLPVVVAPILSAPADARTRAGVPTDTVARNDSRGPGGGGGVGSGTADGIGEGDGDGVGPGSGGGTGGGPFRPGSGIEPPRLLREVKADYTEDARRRGVSGDVVLEIVVRLDGTVGDVRVLQGLGYGLEERATSAVRQWRFAPATRVGSPVDVIVEVAVEFKLR